MENFLSKIFHFSECLKIKLHKIIFIYIIIFLFISWYCGKKKEYIFLNNYFIILIFISLFLNIIYSLFPLHKIFNIASLQHYVNLIFHN